MQFAVINYSFETEFWYIYVLYWINLLLWIFFLARDRSLKLNTSFPVLYFDEVSMYNCYWILEDQGYRQTCAPLLKLEGACVPSFLGPRFESIQRCLTHAGPSAPLPSQRRWEGHVSPPSADPRSHVINSEMSDIGQVTCAPLLKLWEGHVLPSPFPLLIHSEMFHRPGHLCPLLKS